METPSLTYLLSAYFHQDFVEEYGGVWNAVDAFIERDLARARMVPGEVAELLICLGSESDVDDYVDQTGCEYAAQPEDGGYRGWLSHVADHIARRLST